IESLEYEEARALIHRKVTERLAYYVERGYITPALFAELNADHTREYKDATASVRSIGSQSADELTKRVIRIFAIGIEKRHLKVLYHYDEVSEQVYKRILHK